MCEPAGTDESRPGLHPIFFQPSLRDCSFLQPNPGLASWAKFSRPCGTEFENGVLTHVLQLLFRRIPHEMLVRRTILSRKARGLKPGFLLGLTARLKSGPDTKHQLRRRSENSRIA